MARFRSYSAPSSRRKTVARGAAAGSTRTRSWSGSCTTRSGSTCVRPKCGSAADRPVAKKHWGQCRPQCPSAMSAVLFRDIQQCSGVQILIRPRCAAAYLLRSRWCRSYLSISARDDCFFSDDVIERHHLESGHRR